MPSVTLISALPSFASPEEHASAVGSTPNSFSDIPSVLKHKEENVSVTLEPPLEGISSAVQGTLYVLTSILAFMPSSGTSGFQIEYPAITLHAVSRGESGPSIYCQLDETYGNSNGLAITRTTNGDENDTEDSEMRELTIVPQNASSLEPIFEALSQCASLHPDPLDADELDGEGFDESSFVDPAAFETFNGDETAELSEVGRAALEYMESIIDDPHKLVPEEVDEEAFADAEETKESTVKPDDDKKP